MTKKLLLFAILINFPALIFGQSIWTNPITGTSPGTSNPYTSSSSQIIDANITVGGIGRGSGLTGGITNNAYGTSGWSTSNNVNTNNYFEFTLTPSTGYQIDFSSFVYTSSSTSGPRNFVLRSNLDNYSSNIDGIKTSTTGNTFSLGSQYKNINEKIIFRLYGYDASNSLNIFSINDFVFNGITSCNSIITATGATICQGSSGTMTYGQGSSTISTNQISGAWNIATDPVAYRPGGETTGPFNDTQTCLFVSSESKRVYVATVFQVSVTGNYTFKMTNTNAYDGIAYIYNGNFTPGDCSSGGNFIRGDDDDGVTGTEPRMSNVPLVAGITYTLISTQYDLPAVNANFTWTITPPSGGGLVKPNWYTLATGGTSIGDTSPFNPVGVANSGLSDTNTAITKTYYVSFPLVNTCRTAVDFVIKEKAVISAMTASACTGIPFSVTPTAPTGTTYTWSAPTMPSGVSGASAGSAASVIAGNLTNTNTTAQTVTYNITPLTGTCTGNSFNLVVTVSPTSAVGAVSANQSICTATSPLPITIASNTGAIQWQVSTNNSLFTDISGANASPLTSAQMGSLTATRYYRAIVTSGGCTPATSGTVTVTVSPTSAVGAVSADQSICTATSPLPITIASNTGAIQWQVSTNNSLFTDISGANASPLTSAQMGSLTATRYYRAIVTSGGCTPATSGTVTVTVSPTSAVGAVSADQSICTATSPLPITIASNTGAIQWQVSTNNSLFTDISGANASPLTSAQMGSLTATRYYRAIVTSGGCTPATSGTVTVTVSPTSAVGAVSADQSICTATSPLPITIASNTGAIQWQVSTNNSLFTDISGANASPLTSAQMGSLTATRYYRAIVTSGGCTPATSGTVTVTVSPTSAVGAVSANQSICTATSPLPITIASNTGAIQWQVSTNNSLFTDISGANASPLTSAQMGSLTATRYYRAIVTSGGCTPATSGTVTVTVSPTSAVGAVSADQSICTATSPLPITIASNTGAIQWQVSTNNSLFTDISGANASPLTSAQMGSLTATRYYRAIVTSGGCTPATSGTVTVTVSPTSAVGAVSADQSICTATSPLPITIASNTGAIQWQVSTNNSLFTDISGANASPLTSAQMGSLTATRYYRAIVTSGGCTPATSGTVTVTVSPISAVGAVSANQSICTATSPLPITIASNTGAIQWQVSTNNSLFTDISGANASPLTSAQMGSLTATRYYRAIVTSGGCTPATSGTVTVTVSPTSAVGAVSADQSICTATSPLPITIASNTGAIQWQVSTNNSLFTDISGANASPLTSAQMGSLTATRYYRAIVTSDGCTPATSGTVTVTVSPTSAVGAVSADQSICTATSPLPITIASNTGAIQWQVSTNNSLFTDISGANASPLTSAQMGSLTATRYYRAIVTSGACSSVTSTTVTVTVNAYPTITTPPQALSLCVGQNGSFKLVPGVPAQSYQWEYSSDGVSGWQITDTAADVTGHTTTELSLTNVQLGYSGYYVRCVLTNGTCPVYTTPVQLTVNPLPTAPTASVTTQPTCALNTATITVSSPAAGSGFEYSLDGTAYVISAVFTGVSVGPHNITVKRTSTGCESAQTPITVAPSAAKKWNGSTSTDWNTAANWTPNGVPTLADCVEIPNISVKPVIEPANGHYNAYTLTVDANGSLTVGSTNTLTVENAVTVLGSGATAGALIFENNSSLLQTNTASNINTGNITYKRTTSLVRRYDLTFWSSPVTLASGFKLYDLSPQTLGDKFYIYNSLTESWITDYNGGTVMVPGKGYTVRAPQTYDIISTAYFTASFVGVPNNGDILLGTLGSKWNFGGNPYPSALNAKKLITDNGNVGSLYLWTHSTAPSNVYLGDGIYNYNTADYAVFNLTGTAATTSPSNIPTGYIAAGQGFFFTPSDSNGIKFTNDMRVVGSNEQFFKNEKADDVDKSRVWLNLTNKDGAFKQALIGYIDGATNSWDMNYDAPTISGNSYIDFYSINDSRKLTVQGRALPFDNSEVVPLGYKSTIAGDFTIAIDHADGLFSEQAVYLEDKTIGKIQNLTTGNYNFTTAIGTFTDRFVLRYTNKTLGTDDFENLENTVLVSVKDKMIKINTSKESIKEVTIYDVSGKLLYNKKKIEATELQISNLQSSNQVLLVKVTLENDFTTTKKIIFK